MREKFLLSLIVASVFALVIFSSLIQACLTLNTYKTEFLPQDTMQVEINLDSGQQLVKDIYTSDLFLYNSGNQLMSSDYFLVKVSEGKYFAWFNVPSVPGTYTFKVRASCGSYAYTSINFKVNSPKSVYYSALENQVRGKWSLLKIEELVLSSAALSYNEDLSQDALAAYYARQDSCINSACSTKNASLALISFKDFSTRSQMKNLMDAYQNNLRGEWKLWYISPYAQDCNLTIENSTRDLDIFPNNNVIDIDLSGYSNLDKVSISDTCNLTERKMVFQYQEMEKNFTIANNFVMSNLGCFGSNLKAACDPESTAYALFSGYISGFDINDKDHAVTWLKNNAVAIDQVAIAYLYTRDENSLNQILSSQMYNGAWQKNGKNDVQATVTIYYILGLVENKSSNVLTAISKAKSYLEQSLDTSSLADKSYTLFFVFPNIEPLMSIWPGIVKTSSGNTFSVLLQNNGIQDIEVDASILNSSMSVNVSKGSMKNLQISVPNLGTPNGDAITEFLSIQYSNNIINSMTKTYSVPVIIFTLNGSGSSGNFSMNQSPINPNQSQGIINGTMNSSLINKTAELNESLIRQNFYFSESNISRNIYSTGIFSINVNLLNKLSDSITNIILQKSASLQDLQVNPATINELGANQTNTITIYVDPSTIGNKVDGTIVASGKYNNQEVDAILYLSFVSNMTQNQQTCVQLGGLSCFTNQTCKGNATTVQGMPCCLGTCNVVASSKSKTVAIVIVILVVLILVGVLFFLKRKPKKDDKDFMQNVSKEIKPYEDDEFKKPQSKEFKEEFGEDFGNDSMDLGSQDSSSDFKEGDLGEKV